MAQFVFWVFVGNFIVLTYMGICPVEPPFELVGIISSILYFLFYIVYPFTWFIWESVIFDEGMNVKDYPDMVFREKDDVYVLKDW